MQGQWLFFYIKIRTIHQQISKKYTEETYLLFHVS